MIKGMRLSAMNLRFLLVADFYKLTYYLYYNVDKHSNLYIKNLFIVDENNYRKINND